MKIEVLDCGYIELVESWGSDETIVEEARQSTQKGFLGWGTAESPGDEKLLRYLWTEKHSTPFEFAGARFHVKAPIFVLREWHRHRTQSYSEASARYAPLPNEDYLPTLERVMQKGTSSRQTQGLTELTETGAANFLGGLMWLQERAQTLYEEALLDGVPKELARLALTVGRYSRMGATANLLNWLKFCTLRQAPNAQQEIRVYADAMNVLLSERFPRTLELFNSPKP